MRGQRWDRFQSRLRTELGHLLTINTSDRRWQMPLAAALALGLPLLVGAYFDHMTYGLVSSLGGMVFLYLPNTPMHHRMVALMTCAFGMIACYALGVISHFLPLLIIFMLTFIAILVTMVCRYYALGPPGSLFFVMAAAVGAYSPISVLQVPLFVGLLALGTVLACLIAFFYSIFQLRRQPPPPLVALPAATFDFVVFDAIVIGSFVGISLVLAHVLELQRAYWVPISCLAVIQGVTMRAVWNKQVQRIIGTGIGLLLAWPMLALPVDKWGVSLLIMLLAFVIEFLVVRHYGLAVIFITPLTVLLTEATDLGHAAAAVVIQARFFDIVLGSVIGLLGGVCLHSPRFRTVVGAPIRRLIPARLLP